MLTGIEKGNINEITDMDNLHLNAGAAPCTAGLDSREQRTDLTFYGAK